MVECDNSKAESDTEQASSGMSFNIHDIIGQISNFMGNIRDFSSGASMGVNVEGFNIALSKDRGEYEIALRLRLAIKHKQSQ